MFYHILSILFSYYTLIMLIAHLLVSAVVKDLFKSNSKYHNCGVIVKYHVA